MALPNLSLLEVINNINAASIDAVYIKKGSEKWQTLGYIANASIEVTNLSTTTSSDEIITNNAYHVSVKFDMLETDVEDVLSLLDDIVGNQCDFLVKTFQASSNSEGWIYLDKQYFGAKLRYINDGDVTKTAVITVELSGSVSYSAIPGLWSHDISQEEFETSSDFGTFHALGDYGGLAGGIGKAALIVPAGLREVEYITYGVGGDNTAIQNIGTSSLTIDYNVHQLPDMRYVSTNSATVTLEIDWIHASENIISKISQMAENLVAVKVKMYNGKNLQFEKLGMVVNVINSEDVKKERLLHIRNTGTIILNLTQPS